MRKMNLLHGALLIGLAVFGIDYNARHAGYDVGLKENNIAYEQKISNLKESSDKTLYEQDKIFSIYQREIADLKANHEKDMEINRHDSFKRGWETGYERAVEKYAPEPEIYVDDEPMKSSPGGSADSMDSRTGDEKLLRALKGIRESTDELSPYAIPDFTP